MFAAVAYSGGPDSTCLLWLLNKACELGGDPLAVMAMSVNHSLQAASTSMALHCTRFTEKHGIPHTSLQICWGSPGFPARPRPSEAFERVARDARRRLFLDCMENPDVNTSVLATGHHLDDQVETLLMGRMVSPESSQTISSCRRWGMGDSSSDEISFAGLRGMNKWIVRPLLSFSKARTLMHSILATCEQHGLEYVTDSTNFQPDITRRNAVRHFLHMIGHHDHDFDVQRLSLSSEPRFSSVVRSITTSLKHSDLRQPQPQAQLQPNDGSKQSITSALYGIASSIHKEKESLEENATAFLSEQTQSISPSTLILIRPQETPSRDFSRTVLFRILQHISPHPWGSVAAQAYRNNNTIDSLAQKLWAPEGSGGSDHNTSPFAAGALVLWTPVVIRQDGTWRRATPTSLQVARERNHQHGWLVSRQPQISLPRNA
ncbi:PP-loop family-domain-containing protein [Auriculariales sp. MPI-PUGE-AT-0066]|nr:PP-loop family-domain-containing protein [Auriculariales sp. MPI-PUGE-AT-0066]